jgi:predicted AlkP superfamily phosphohydrolase/phosphomutase
MTATNKLLVIGIDGAPYDLIARWTALGELPNLARLIQRGCFGILNSTIPVHSPTAWTSFITGLNPGQHGVFDFVRREPGSYELRVVRADQIPGASLWRLIGEQGYKVGVMNVPMTYPPEPVNGFLLSGLGTPDFAGYAFPPELKRELDAQGYRVNNNFFFVHDRQDEWLADVMAMTDMSGRTAVQLMGDRPWDFFMVVFRNSDEICHFFWHHMDETHPRYDPHAPANYKRAILDLYRRIDHWVGELVAAAGKQANVVVMSDHGAGPLYRDVFLNEWLWRQGWLALKEQPASRQRWMELARRAGITRANISDRLTRLNLHRAEVLIKRALGERIRVLPRDERLEFHEAIDWSQTKAYSFGYYGQIFINLKGREPQGIVEPGTGYEAVREAIAQQLLTLVDPADGRPVVDRVYRKEELYHGRYLDEAPDLLAIMRGLSYTTRKGYEFADERGMIFREPYTSETGSHRLEGIVAAAGPDIRCLPALTAHSIQDLTPTLLHLLHCPIPRYMDRRPILELLQPAFLEKYPLQYTETEISLRHDTAAGWDEADEAEITERLKKLGYLG